MPTSGPAPRHLTLDQFQAGCASYVGRKPQNRVRSSKGSNTEQEEDEGVRDLGPELYAIGWKWEEHSMLPQLSHLKRVIEVVPPERADQEHSEGEDEDEDPILSSGLSHGTAPQVDTSMTYPTPASNTITCTQEIFYSSTWSTPVLYLQAHHTETGHPLCLEEMMDPRLGVFLPGEDGEGSSSTPQRGAGTVRRSRLHALLPQSSAAAAGDRENGSEDGETLTEPLAEDGALPVSNEDRIAPAYFPPLSQSDHPITSLPCISLHPCQTAVVIGEMMQARSVIQEKDDDHREESVYGKEYLEAFITICANAVEMRG